MHEVQKQSGPLRPRKSRRAEVDLKQPLANRVAAYALAAGGAGLGVVAGAQPAQARIVYTPANIFFENRAVIDVDNVEFTITQIKEDNFGYTFILELRGNGSVLATSRFPGWAGRLAAGAKIGASGHFYRGAQMANGATYNCCPSHTGPWDSYAPPHISSGFLGLQFLVNGQRHYGWAEVSVLRFPQSYPLAGFQGVVKGYAYNTVANQPILAGQTSDNGSIGELQSQPATLGLLALGAPGLDVWRRRELAAEQPLGLYSLA